MHITAMSKFFKKLTNLTTDDAPIRKLALSYFRSDNFKSALYWFQKIKKRLPVDINNLAILYNDASNTSAVRTLFEQHDFLRAKWLYH